MNLTDKQASDLLAELAPDVRQPGDIDRWMAAEAWGITEKAAESRLIQLVKDGVLISLYAYDHDRRRRMRLYRKV